MEISFVLFCFVLFGLEKDLLLNTVWWREGWWQPHCKANLTLTRGHRRRAFLGYSVLHWAVLELRAVRMGYYRTSGSGLLSTNTKVHLLTQPNLSRSTWLGYSSICSVLEGHSTVNQDTLISYTYTHTRTYDKLHFVFRVSEIRNRFSLEARPRSPHRIWVTKEPSPGKQP